MIIHRKYHNDDMKVNMKPGEDKETRSEEQAKKKKTQPEEVN